MALCLGVIGCGKMAHAILKGLSFLPEKYEAIYVYDIQSERCDLFAHEFKAVIKEPGNLVQDSDMILLAVKPNQIESILSLIAGSLSNDKLLVSIAAGIKTSTIEKLLTNHCPVVRVMPNTPALVGKGIAAICGGKRAHSEHLELVQALFNAVGSSVLVEEKHMDAVTAVSGSGPAYVFLVAEAMINAAVNVGLDAALARQLVIETMQGSVAMMEDKSQHPAVLRENVCSPGGTTIAAVRYLEENGLRRAFFDAVEAAWHRSIELGQDK